MLISHQQESSDVNFTFLSKGDLKDAFFHFRNSSGHSHILRIMSRLISENALKNGSFFFTAGPRYRGKSPFSRK